jgi:hypothetical protein
MLSLFLLIPRSEPQAIPDALVLRNEQGGQFLLRLRAQAWLARIMQEPEMVNSKHILFHLESLLAL